LLVHYSVLATSSSIDTPVVALYNAPTYQTSILYNSSLQLLPQDPQWLQHGSSTSSNSNEAHDPPTLDFSHAGVEATRLAKASEGLWIHLRAINRSTYPDRKTGGPMGQVLRNIHQVVVRPNGFFERARYSPQVIPRLSDYPIPSLRLAKIRRSR
jgi:hypothetical protein